MNLPTERRDREMHRRARQDTWRSLVHGLTAGAVGTAVLNAITHLDMALRDRPASDVPERSVERLAGLVGVQLRSDEPNDSGGAARTEGLGALFGFATGCTIGAAYSMVRPRLGPDLNPLAVGIGVGVAAMISTISSYSSLGVSDPRTWSPADWAADIVPHLGYGLATVATLEGLT